MTAATAAAASPAASPAAGCCKSCSAPICSKQRTVSSSNTKERGRVCDRPRVIATLRARVREPVFARTKSLLACLPACRCPSSPFLLSSHPPPFFVRFRDSQQKSWSLSSAGLFLGYGSKLLINNTIPTRMLSPPLVRCLSCSPTPSSIVSILHNHQCGENRTRQRGIMQNACLLPSRDDLSKFRVGTA